MLGTEGGNHTLGLRAYLGLFSRRLPLTRKEPTHLKARSAANRECILSPLLRHILPSRRAVTVIARERIYKLVANVLL